jgi:hypothetical protein
MTSGLIPLPRRTLTPAQKRNGARLIRQPKHPLDTVGAILKLLPGQRLAFAVPHMQMKERLFGLCRPATA